MNLVQQQEALRTLPIPALQAKAQGQDPDTPPWLAASVLNERVADQQKAELAQGAAQGPTPSVAEQLQQKAGLMALQAQQQQQAQQQMMQQMAQAPQAVPQEVPQPQAQPQAPAMMAGGGLARLPVDPRMFNYKEGGVIGFDGTSGSQVYPGMIAQEGEGLMPAKTGYEGMSILEFIQKFGMDAYNKIKNAIPGESTDERRARQKREVYEASAQGQRDKAMEEVNRPEPVDSMKLPPRPADPRFSAGLASLQKPPPRPAPAPRSAPAPSAAQPPQPPQAAPAATSELQGLMMGALKNEPKAMSVAEALAEYNDAMPADRRQPAGLEQLARLKQQQAQYEKSKESLPMENWMRGLAAAARGGIGGFGYADIENTERGRAADAAQAAYQDKVMTAVESMRRGEATAEQKAILDRVGKSSTATSEEKRNRLTQLTSARSSELSSQTQKEVGAAHDATSLQIAQINKQATILAANGRLGTQEANLALNTAKALLAEAEKTNSKYAGKVILPKDREAARQAAANLDAAREAVRKLQPGGSTMPPSPGAAAPAQKRAPLESFQK